MRFINKETELELIIDSGLVQRIADYGTKKYPNEFGGLLLGRYVNNNKTVVIEDTLLPKKYKSSRYLFERGSEGLIESLEFHYNAVPSLIYVGEWHTHPDNPARPSLTDLKAMTELADDKNVLITNPVLMIIEVSQQDYVWGIYFLYNNNLLRYDEKAE
ncbi:MAG: Mov34/MPN/PAD-1 family protein [Agriterribacter sp.]